MNNYQYEVGDIVKLKKQHPCGSQEWEILRVGADFRLKCMGCDHQIMIARNWWRRIPKGFERKMSKKMKQNRKNNKKNTCETGQIMLSYRLVICKNSLLPA